MISPRSLAGITLELGRGFVNLYGALALVAHAQLADRRAQSSKEPRRA